MTTTELAGITGVVLIIAAPIAITLLLERDLHRRRRRHPAAHAADEVTVDLDLIDRILDAYAEALRPTMDAIVDIGRRIGEAMADTFAELTRSLTEAARNLPDEPAPGVQVHRHPRTGIPTHLRCTQAGRDLLLEAFGDATEVPAFIDALRQPNLGHLTGLAIYVDTCPCTIDPDDVDTDEGPLGGIWSGAMSLPPVAPVRLAVPDRYWETIHTADEIDALLAAQDDDPTDTITTEEV